MTDRRLLSNRNAASTVEFALVLPLLLIFLFGIIDAGRYMWSINRAEKAAQMGVRMAVVTNFVSSAIDADFVGQCGLQAGDPIPANCFAPVVCTKSGASATCTSGTTNTVAFNQVLARIRLFMPEVQQGNVQIIYSASGLGYAGDPNGPDVAPLVTVRLFGLTYRPIASFMFLNIGLPDIRSSLTLEDGIGTQSN